LPDRRNDWLAELKRALPTERNEQSQENTTVERLMEREPQQVPVPRKVFTPMPAVSSGGSTLAFSSDEEDDADVEVDMIDMFRKGQKIKRYHSTNSYDREYASLSSTRAPSQISYSEAPFPTCPPTPYTNRPVSPGKPPRSPKIAHRYQGAVSAPM
jgi:hypothetical protein